MLLCIFLNIMDWNILNFTQSLETANKCPKSRIFNTVRILRYGNVLNSRLAEAAGREIALRTRYTRHTCISISRCLPESSLGRARKDCGEGLIQDSPKFADSWGKTRNDQRTMGRVADDELSACFPGVALGDCWNSRKQGGWASQRFYHRPRYPSPPHTIPHHSSLPLTTPHHPSPSLTTLHRSWPPFATPFLSHLASPGYVPNGLRIPERRGGAKR